MLLTYLGRFHMIEIQLDKLAVLSLNLLHLTIWASHPNTTLKKQSLKQMTMANLDSSMAVDQKCWCDCFAFSKLFIIPKGIESSSIQTMHVLAPETYEDII